jgi:UDP-N-acetylmuramoylalanine--D-glutamate ligase
VCFYGNSACSRSATLEEALNYFSMIMQPHDIVLFSPGGTSFDLFNDYKHRGKTFQQLVKTLNV